MQSIIRRTLEVFRNEGLGAAGKKAKAKVGNFLYRSNAAVWFSCELTKTESPETSPVPGSFSSVDPAELARWLQEKNLEWAADPRELEVAAELGHRWTNWKLEDEIVAFAKIGGERIFVVDFERVVPLPRNLALLTDIYVLPEARKKRIGRELLLATMRLLAEGPYSVMSCHIPESNFASIRLFESVGFRPSGKITYTRILGFPTYSERPEAILKKMASTSAGATP